MIYTAGEVVFKTTNQGKAGRIDQSRSDSQRQIQTGVVGRAITQDNTSVEYYDTIFALAESPVEKGLLWAGSDDGLIHVTRNGGGSLAERDAAGAAGVEHGEPDRTLAARGRRGLRRDR